MNDNKKARKPISPEELLHRRIQAIKDIVLTPERQAQFDVEMEISEDNSGYAFKAAQMPFDMYYQRHLITKQEHIAASKLFKDFTISGQSPGMVINLIPIGNGTKDFTQAQMEARDRWRQAVNAIAGEMGKIMAINVCCYGYYLKDVNYIPYTDKQSLPRFREALEDLLRYYKNNSLPR